MDATKKAAEDAKAQAAKAAEDAKEKARLAAEAAQEEAKRVASKYLFEYIRLYSDSFQIYQFFA